MLKLLRGPARTIVAVAAFVGLSRSEIRGLEWPDYTGDRISVVRSAWESVVSETKTRAGKAPVPVTVPMQRLLDQFMLTNARRKNEASQETPNRGKSANGPQVSRLTYGDHLPPRPIFATMKGTRLSLNNVLNRQILPVLNACVKCGKVRSEHGKADHEYERDSRRPEWHGWHAFRRGLATNLHDLGVDDKTIQAILRHANVAVTLGCYIKTLDSQSIAAMQQLESLVDVKMLAASKVVA